MDDHHILAFYAKKMGQFLNRWPAAVHKRHRFGQKHLNIIDEPTPVDTVELSFVQRDIEIPGDFVDRHETGIMPGALIAGSRISEADDQSQYIAGYIADARKPHHKSRLDGLIRILICRQLRTGLSNLPGILFFFCGFGGFLSLLAFFAFSRFEFRFLFFDDLFFHLRTEHSDNRKIDIRR